MLGRKEPHTTSQRYTQSEQLTLARNTLYCEWSHECTCLADSNLRIGTPRSRTVTFNICTRSKSPQLTSIGALEAELTWSSDGTLTIASRNACDRKFDVLSTATTTCKDSQNIHSWESNPKRVNFPAGIGDVTYNISTKNIYCNNTIAQV